MSLLHVAAFNGHSHIVKELLLSKKVNCDAKSEDNITVSDLANVMGHQHIVRFIENFKKLNEISNDLDKIIKYYELDAHFANGDDLQPLLNAGQIAHQQLTNADDEKSELKAIELLVETIDKIKSAPIVNEIQSQSFLGGQTQSLADALNQLASKYDDFFQRKSTYQSPKG